MKILTNIFVAFIALEHLFFMTLEMFFWNKPLGLKIFRTDQDFADKSKILAANQGLYNGLLSTGLIWSLFSSSPEQALALKIYFLLCVLLAGIYGAYTVGKSILFLQALPAFMALIILWIQFF
jgi:putative membrane protein